MKPQKKKLHPVLLILDIIIAVLTLILAVSIVMTVYTEHESDRYRYAPENYSYDMQEGNYKNLAVSFAMRTYHPIPEDQITPALLPYAAVGRYYKDSFYLRIYETMGDTERAAQAREALTAERTDMGVYQPEADKIDRIFSGD
ncbi:MAG: hypothetical protein IKO80_04895 [Lachnospiraceae bacterium]|nr:hypothetical protein [Lachnospiraceae bacterium]